MFGKIALGVFSLSLLSQISFASECKIKLNKSNQEKRSVLLAGGNAYQLLEGYMQQLKKDNIDVKAGDIKVYFHTGQELKEVELSWRDWLSGKGVQEMWKSKLSKYEAKISSQELAKADKMGFDIYCISSEPVVSNQPQKVTKKGVCSAESNSHIQLGIQFINNKDYDNAQKEFEAATKLSNCPLAYANLASLYLLKKNYNFAVDTYKKGLEVAGEDGFLHFTGAVIYTQKKDYDYAIDALGRALKLGFNDKTLLTSTEIKPLLKERKKEFCSLLDSYKIVIKECL